jgi:hypothetical protein
VSSSLGPKPLTEAPPPTYEEALDRQTVRLTDIEEQAGHAEQEEVPGTDLAREVRDNNITNLEGISSEPTDDIVIQPREEILEPRIRNTENISIEDTDLERLEPTGDDQILPAGQEAAIADIGEDEVVGDEATVIDEINISNEEFHNVETAKSEKNEAVQNGEINKTDENYSSMENNDNESNLAGEESEKLLKDNNDGNTCESDKSSNVVHV